MLAFEMRSSSHDLGAAEKFHNFNREIILKIHPQITYKIIGHN